MKRLLLGILLFAVFPCFAQVTLTKYNINPSAASSPTGMYIFNNKLYFAANDGSHGIELWSTDGTDVPTLVADINAGSGNGMSAFDNRSIAAVNNKLYFAADNGSTGMELFVYDGTHAPTLAKDIESGSASSDPTDFVAYNNMLYFAATTTANGKELWVYDPANNTANRMTDVSSGAASSDVQFITVMGSTLYFTATSATSGNELYSLDPSNGSVHMIADINSGSAGSNPGNLLVYNSKLYFTATSADHGSELYAYDGNNAPVRLTDISPGVNSSFFINTNDLVVYNSKIYFSASANGGLLFNMYVFDPATSNASMVTAITQTSPGSMVSYKSKLFYRGTASPHGQELYSYNGNLSVLVSDIYTGPNNSSIDHPIVYKQWLYFTANDGTNGVELMRIEDASSGIISQYANAEIMLYPNPAQDMVHFKLDLGAPETLQIRFLDITGRVVYTADATTYNSGVSYINIPVAKLATGYYTYTVLRPNSIAAKGIFVKQ